MTINPIGSYFWMTKPSQTTWPAALYNYTPSVNLKIAGERAVLVSGASQAITGTQTGDNLPALPEAPLFLGSSSGTWGYMANPMSPDENASYSPSITVEIITDQGVVNP